MKLVVLGLSLSSSWGNGHATTYRALLKAFVERGNEVLFLERDAPWYASHRDLIAPPWCRLELYSEFDELGGWQAEIARADAVIVGSYTPQGVRVGRRIQQTAGGVAGFYDIDTPVTLAKLARNDHEYISPELVAGYDLYLSFTGGPMLGQLERAYGSPAARALYCSVDETMYQPVASLRRWDLSYLGTYSPDRQPALERLLLEPARAAPHLRFAVAGPQYPADVDWPSNVERIDHVPPAEHAAFYSASRYTLNITRTDMVEAGWSPSVRLFEAAACRTPVISDMWPGLEAFFLPDKEIVLAQTSAAVLQTLAGGEAEREARANRAQERVLAAHTARHRAAELERALMEAAEAPARSRRTLMEA